MAGESRRRKGERTMTKRGIRQGVTVLLCLLAGLLLVTGIYVIYVFVTYYRLEDNLTLEITGEAAGVPATEEHYRVVSYNIGFGAYGPDYTFFMDGGTESRARSPQEVQDHISGAIAAVQAADPDLVFLQEVDVDGTRSYHIDEYQLILDQLGEGREAIFAQNYDSPYLLWPLTSPHGANRAGIATFSSFGVEEATRRSLPIEGGFMKLVDLDRCYTKARIPMDNGRELVIYNLHLSAYTSDGSIAEEQLEMLFADMLKEYEAGNYVVGGGDFNKDLLGNSPEIFGVSGKEYTWAQAIPAEVIPEGLAVMAPLDEEDPVPSCRNADRPYGPDDFVVTVDGFIVSANVTVEECKVIDTAFQWSDHNPVYLDFVLQP